MSQDIVFQALLSGTWEFLGILSTIDSDTGSVGAAFSPLTIFTPLLSVQQFGCQCGILFEEKGPQLKHVVRVFLWQVEWVSSYMFLGGSNEKHRLRGFKSQFLGFTTLYLSLPISKIRIIVVPVSLTAENEIS